MSSCSTSAQSTVLLRNQQLRSNPDGTPRVHWSDNLGFETCALRFRALFLYFSAETSARVLARRSLDGVTWTLANDGAGYIDGLNAGYSSLGEFSFQYLGDPDDRGPFFEIGIEVSDLVNDAEGVVTLSAAVEFGSIRPLAIDLTPTVGTLSLTTNPTLVPGADIVRTGGCRQVRVELAFATAPGYVVTLYLATGPTSTAAGLYVDQQTKVTAVDANATSLSMVVDAPDLWSTVYYTVGTTTTGNVQALKIVPIP